MKSVLIIGGARRIGRGLALNFAKKGFNVIFTYNKSISEAEKTYNELVSNNHKVLKYKVDIINEYEIIDLFDKIAIDYGKIDILVNNAGIFTPKTKIEDINENLWDEANDINLKSQFFISKHFIKIANQNAKIINFASLGGLEVWNQRIPYNVSKAGAIQLTKALARELAPNIAVNCICPGFIDIPDEKATDASNLSLNKIPMGRYGSVDDIFELVYFLSTCTNFITGQIINVDGGLHLTT